MENKCCEKCRVRCRCPEPHAPGHGDKCANKSCPCHSPAPRESAKELLYGFWKEYYEISRWDRDSVIEKHADILEAKLEAARREGAAEAVEYILKQSVMTPRTGVPVLYIERKDVEDARTVPTQHREGSN